MCHKVMRSERTAVHFKMKPNTFIFCIFLYIVLVFMIRRIAIKTVPVFMCEQDTPNASFPTRRQSHTDRRPRYMKLDCPLGRTGNQLFQYAMLMSISDCYNYIPIVPEDFPLRDYLEIPPPPPGVTNVTNVKKLEERLCQKYLPDIENLNTQHNWTFWGYFQSFKYQNTSLLKSIMKIRSDLLKPARQFLYSNVDRNTVTVGIHVRRQDVFLRRGAAVGMDFISRAMNHYRKMFANTVRFIVASDDMRWCKENIPVEYNDTVFSIFPDPGHDLALMSLCDHMIISAGTFSWWCGWFCDGEVVYWNGYPDPDNYIGFGVNADIYYPKEWIPMK